MNTGMAVLLALVLIAVVLLIVWLVLRSRASSADAPAAAASGGDRIGADHADDGESGGPDPAVPAGVGTAAAPDPADSDEIERTGAAALGSAGDDPSDGADLAEEYADPGLSRLGDSDTAAQGAHEGTADTGTADDVLAPAPRTPAEAFGDAGGGATADRPGPRSGTSVLDEPDVDSTPLFRSIREERLAGGGTAPAGATLPAEEPEVVGEQPDLSVPDRFEPHGSWSSERRGWDEQAHDVEVAGAEVEGADVDEVDVEPRSGVTDSDGATVHAEDHDGAADVPAAVAADQAAPDEGAATTDEEDHDVPTDQGTSAQIATTGTAADESPAEGGQPPVRRISELHEVVDGGFGIGSAAPIADGAQPLGHPIKASVDTKTYQDLHSPWYDTTEPDVWFLDAGFAERAGFHRAE